MDFYRLIDQKIIVALVKAVEQRTLSEGEITKLCRERRQSHWYRDFKTLYTAIESDVYSDWVVLFYKGLTL